MEGWEVRVMFDTHSNVFPCYPTHYLTVGRNDVFGIAWASPVLLCLSSVVQVKFNVMVNDYMWSPNGEYIINSCEKGRIDVRKKRDCLWLSWICSVV